MFKLTVLTTLAFLSLGATFAIAQEPIETKEEVKVEEQIDPRERVRRATFDMFMTGEEISGTAFLVSRKKVYGKDRYLYRAITAFHVVSHIARDPQADSAIIATFQPEFHGAMLQIYSYIQEVDWAIPIHDWASFTFESNNKLECAELATKEEFESVTPFDTIYMIGAMGRYGQLVRKGTMGATHSRSIFKEVDDELIINNVKIDAGKFFRSGFTGWYGDSGAPVFTEDGKIIGVFSFFLLVGREQVVYNSSAFMKAHIIRDVVSTDKQFFLVEN